MDKSILKEGILFKQGQYHKSYQERYFVLRTDGSLSYHKQADSLRPVGVVFVQNAAPHRDTHDPLVFHLVTTRRVFHFRATTERDCVEWVSLIRSQSSLMDEVRLLLEYEEETQKLEQERNTYILRWANMDSTRAQLE
eukprot:TRINITY_DN444_c0_g1_i1.p1 TRINITY_DN444_c0_g1~~TRINITY_DN444_c0_g1_i1.p1  ORF type:complete len:138 (+),score=28.81 TRINITY_DN444_c0_g1_i1:87-500(+)